jgi:hypothetical protein
MELEEKENSVFCDGYWWNFGKNGGIWRDEEGGRKYILTKCTEEEKIIIYILLSKKAKRK